jgi:hypothetical protein
MDNPLPKRAATLKQASGFSQDKLVSLPSPIDERVWIEYEDCGKSRLKGSEAASTLARQTATLRDPFSSRETARAILAISRPVCCSPFEV